MATLNVKFYKDGKCVGADTVVGQKQTQAFIKRFGDSETKMMYYVRKRNKFGIRWIVCSETRYDEKWSVSTDSKIAENKIPWYDHVVVHIN